MHTIADIEPWLLPFVRNLRGRTFVDVGSNAGVWSSGLAKRFLRVVSVDPDPRNPIPIIIGGERDSHHHLQFAAWSSRSTLRLNRYKSTTHSSAFHRLPDIETGPAVDVIEVEAAPLDQLLGAHDGAEVDFIKIDTEGAEVDVLRGAEEIIRSSTPVLLVECHSYERRVLVIAFLKAAGYRVAIIPHPAYQPGTQAFYTHSWVFATHPGAGDGRRFGFGFFSHSGDLGDIIYSMPTMRALGGGYLQIRPDMGRRAYLEPTIVERNLAPLLESQPYVRGVIDAATEIHARVIDLDGPARSRRAGRPHYNLAQSVCDAHGVDRKVLDEPWIEVEAPAKAEAEVVVARSNRYHNAAAPFPYTEVLRRWGRRCVFVGTTNEHHAFQSTFGAIRYATTPSLLAVAKVIASSRLFIGNQSAPFAIAEAMKHRVVQETDPAHPDCVFMGPTVEGDSLSGGTSRPKAFYWFGTEHCDGGSSDLRGDSNSRYDNGYADSDAGLYSYIEEALR